MSDMRYYLVEGGHDQDPDPEQAGRVRVRDLGRHGPDVKTDHLPFTQLSSPAGGNGQNEFNRPPPPGSIVVGYSPRGSEHTGYIHVMGILHGIQQPGIGVPGNVKLPFLETAKNMEAIKNIIPPDIEKDLESNRTGIEKTLSVIKEKGNPFKQSLLDNLPSHGAIFALTGVKNAPLEQITTALSQHSEMLTSGKLGGLPGSLDLKSVMGNLNMGNMDSKMKGAATSFLSQIQNDKITLQPPEGAMFGKQVNAGQLASKMQGVLDSAGNVGELLDGLKSSVSIGSLAGTLQGMTGTTIDVETAFGTIKQTINPDGSSSNEENDNIQKLIQLFLSLLGSILNGGKTLFEQSGTPLNELAGRLEPGIESKIKTIIENTSNSNSKKQRGRIPQSLPNVTDLDIAENKLYTTLKNQIINFIPVVNETS